MNNSRYDVIIVGARCAGATLATYLAKEGLHVLMVDKDKFPSDQVLSTHTIHPPGIDILDEIGIGDEIRSVCPSSHVIRLSKNGATIDLKFRNNRAEYCPRRIRLDGLLQNAAISAGVELLEGTRVIDLVEEDGRVVGVKLQGKGNQSLRSRLIVGADGRNSTVAKLANAEEYLGYDAPRAFYWGYWDTPDAWHDKTQYPFDLYVGNNFGDMKTIFQTDNDQLLIGCLPPTEEVQSWKANPLEKLTNELLEDPLTKPLVQGKEPDGPVRGTVRERYFFRQGTGPGWVLVGDAGHHKEFCIGDGITEALLQAKSLVKAIAENSDQALEKWWRERDVEALPLYFFGQDEGALGAPPGIQSVIINQVSMIPKLRENMALVFEHAVSPYEVFPVSKIFQWTLERAICGNLKVIPEFLKMGQRAAQVQKELKIRKRLLGQLNEAV